MNVGKFLGLLFANKIDYLDNETLFKDSPEEKKPFRSHYQQYIFPHVKQFEEKRVAALLTLRKRAIIAIPICTIIATVVIYLLINYSLSENQTQWIEAIALLIIAALIFWSSIPVTQYKSCVKATIFPNIFSFFGNDYQYSEVSPLAVRSLKPSKIIPYFESEETEDYVKGSYANVGIELMETELTKTKGSGKDRRTVTVFRGIFILFDMNKSFSGKTIIKKDLGIIGNWLQDKFNALENVHLEDPVFEKQFEVYSNDQVEARYLLTTSFMERLLKLSELFQSSSIQCSFYNNKLLLMIPSELNRFETSSIFYPATFVEDIRTILSQMNLIFQVIDVLKLNQKIGL